MARSKKELQPLAGEPFTLPHFLGWAKGLILDTGDPFVLEPFQAAFVDDLFKGKPENWFILPEGNGKTTLIAAVILYHAEFRAEAWVPVAAASRDQAEIAYRQAAGFVDRSPSLSGRFRCFDGYRKIVFKGGKDKITARSSKIQIFAADERTGDGVIPTLAIIDEPHRQRDMGLYRTWTGKLPKRHGQIVAISTAGEPGSEFEEARERIRQLPNVVERTETFIRIIAPGIVMHEWAVPEKGDADDYELVNKANPFSAITVDSLRAKRESPTETVSHWRRFTCNLATRGTDAAITEAEWYAVATPDTIPDGEPIWLGIDVAWKWDTTAFVPFWPRDAEYRLFGVPTVIVPPRDGNSVKPDVMKLALREIHDRNPIHTVVMDMKQAEEIASFAESELGAFVIDRSQANAFAAMDYTRFMEALRNEWLWHPNDPTFTRHVLNAVAHVLPDKKVKFERPQHSRQGGDRVQAARVIDALVAAAMVHGVVAAEFEAGPRWGAA